MREIKQGELVLARVLPAEWPEGLSFHSKDEEFIQVGKWNYPKGKELLAHHHNPSERAITITQEVVYVKKGKLSARIYGTDDTLIDTIELGEGDTLICLAGGHGYDILEDGTQVLEVKNGPYPGEKDRTRL